jgi:peptide chain release factor 3
LFSLYHLFNFFVFAYYFFVFFLVGRNLFIYYLQSLFHSFLFPAMKAKKLRQALVELAEEGVVQLFRPQDGSAPLVGVVGTLQLDVLQARLGAEYGVAIGFETSSFSLARWIFATDKAALAAFIASNRTAMADDVDGDPVFLATSAFMMRRAEELAPGLTFRDIKDIRADKLAA